MPKVAVPECGTCGKAPEIMILWLKSGDSEWVCIGCHLVAMLALVAEQTDTGAEPAAI